MKNIKKENFILPLKLIDLSNEFVIASICTFKIELVRMTILIFLKLYSRVSLCLTGLLLEANPWLIVFGPRALEVKTLE